MKRSLIERNLVVLLFVAVLITFSFAQRDSKKMEQKVYTATEILQKKTLALEETPVKTNIKAEASN
jgi:hypothetical protein